MLESLDISKVLFLDVETVSGQKDYDSLSETFQELWRGKCRNILRSYDEPVSPEIATALYPEKAGIYAEFGKIIVISVGIIVREADGNLKLRLKSFANDDEKILLEAFIELVQQYYDNPNKHFFCGHNLREFDIPYICRRMVANQLPFPKSLDVAGKKPWETKHFLDTMQLWKFGDMKNYTSLKLLAAVLGFPSPKDDIDGSEVGRVYWEDNDLERIAVYCEKDVLSVVQLILKYKRMPILTAEQILHV